MKAKELWDLSVEELQLKHNELRKELFHLLNEFRQTKKIEQAHRLRLIKRDIARTLTVIKEKAAQKICVG